METKDRVRELLIEVLRQALARPGEHRLYRAGKLEGLFPGRTGVSVQAADQALREEFLRRTRVETRAKTEIEWVEITPRGVEFLHQNESAVEALHELRDCLRANQDALPRWLEGMRATLREIDARLTAEASRWQERFQAMEQRLNDTLRRVEAAGPLVPTEVLDLHPWTMDALNYLDRRQTGGAPQGCPLPELFAAIARHHPGLSLTTFHDGLRRLHQRRALHLRPVDDPLEMKRPEFAILDGDGVYYLAVR